MTAPSGREARPVALPPDARGTGEVAVAVALALGVVPKLDRHRRHRLGHDHLTDLVTYRAAQASKTSSADARPATRNLADVHGQQRAPAHESGAYVGSARDRIDANPPAGSHFKPSPAAGRQWRSSRDDRAQRTEIKASEAERRLLTAAT